MRGYPTYINYHPVKVHPEDGVASGITVGGELVRALEKTRDVMLEFDFEDMHSDAVADVAGRVVRELGLKRIANVWLHGCSAKQIQDFFQSAIRAHFIEEEAKELRKKLNS